jgi:uncharacterized protein
LLFRVHRRQAGLEDILPVSDPTATAFPANHLLGETSPYLLQHLHNPVDWYPWGESAFAKAVKEDKPIFLSIGYSACHWCHVMAHESFEDPRTAAILNEHFVAIKVDREELPDVDDVYMTVVQMLTGSGGWPLSVFLTPDKQAFYGGTYYPPTDRHGLPAFSRLLQTIAATWKEKRHELQESAQEISQHLQQHAESLPAAARDLDESAFAGLLTHCHEAFDHEYGGFGHAPKFPPSGTLAMLMRLHYAQPASKILPMVTRTLEAMALGGMYDQLGGGFHRYSVDAQWLVPHFEKMLYDNALLSAVYLDYWRLTGEALAQRIVRETLDYVLRDLQAPDGGFSSAEDADSEGEEGKFYVWTQQELVALLPAAEQDLLLACYGVTEAGNFEGHTILNRPQLPREFASAQKLDSAALEKRLAGLRATLLAARAKRVRPGCDDKVLVDWNGLMISSLARAGWALNEPRYVSAAAEAARFILTTMSHPDGGLYHSYRAGRLRQPAYLDDYAALIIGLVDLYEAEGKLTWLQQAEALAKRLLSDFWDEQDGGFYSTCAAHDKLPRRAKPVYDGAMPSGNALACLALQRLGCHLDKRDLIAKVEIVLGRAQALLSRAPQAFTVMLEALDWRLHGPLEVVVIGVPGAPDTERLLHILRQTYLPRRVLAVAGPEDLAGPLGMLPLLRGKGLVNERATVYLCRNYACQKPITEPAALRAALEKAR